jgi:outer membrane protein assembly factor BamB
LLTTSEKPITYLPICKYFAKQYEGADRLLPECSDQSGQGGKAAFRGRWKDSKKGLIDAVFRQGGQDTTTRGDKVVWGHFYADPTDVSWGNSENPELFVKVWFDVSGRIDVNFFHVSVPNIEVYSACDSDSSWAQSATTITTDRYTRHEYGVIDGGALIWAFPTCDECGEWVFIDYNDLDTVIPISGSGNIYTGTQVDSSPVISNGSVFFGNSPTYTSEGMFFALKTSTGEKIWQFDLGSYSTGSPGVSDEAVYVATSNGKLLSLDKLTGKQNWVYQTGAKEDGIEA